MRINRAMINLILLSGIIGIGCRSTNNSGLRDSVSLEGVRGYSSPGKGFKLLTREVTESICVTGDEGSPNDRVGSPISPDTTVRPTPPRDPGFPDTPFPGTPSTPDIPSTGTPSTPGLPPPFFPPDTTINPSTNPDPYSGSPFGVSKTTGLQAVQKPILASRTNVDAKISPATKAPVKPSTGLALNGQSGGAAVEFYFLESTHDVKRVISLSLNGDAGVGGSPATANADLGANFESQLTSSKLNSSQYVFVLIHGVKTFPVIGSDVITNPTINPKLVKVLFNGAIPTTEEEIIAGYNTFRKQCGDYFIETVMRGREVWMVAAYDKDVFNKTIHGSFSFGARANGPASSNSVDAAVKTANSRIGGGITYDKSDNLMKQTARIFIRTIGRTDFTIGNFTLEDAMERLNKILAADNSEGEGAIELETRPYNNVRLVIGDEEKRLGDIFTAEIERKAGGMDSFKRLADAKAWATKQAKYLADTYKWDQWSLDLKVYNGVAQQYRNLISYADLIDGVFKQCPAGNRELSSASAECVKLADKIAALKVPLVNPPKVLTQQLVFYMPEDIKTLADTKGWESDTKGWSQFQQADARARCEKLGMALPNADNWRKVTENSLFYLQWKLIENAAYRPANDKDSQLAYPCAKFEGANFWSDEPGQVVQIPVGCSAAAVRTSPVPNLSRYSYRPKLLSRYVCVNFIPRTQQ